MLTSSSLLSALRQISDPSHELIKTSPLAISPQLCHVLQTDNGENTFASTNPILLKIHPLLPASLPVSPPHTIHHVRLTVCLSVSNPLPLNFVLDKCL